MVPFLSESIYQNLVRSIDQTAPESVHLCLFPDADESMIDAELERAMDLVLQIVVLGRAARNGANRKNRQPLAGMYVKAEEELNDFYKEIIEEELNVKQVTFTDDMSMFTAYNFKPQLKTLGPKYGKQLGEKMCIRDRAGQRQCGGRPVFRDENRGEPAHRRPGGEAAVGHESGFRRKSAQQLRRRGENAPHPHGGGGHAAGGTV